MVDDGVFTDPVESGHEEIFLNVLLSKANKDLANLPVL